MSAIYLEKDGQIVCVEDYKEQSYRARGWKDVGDWPSDDDSPEVVEEKPKPRRKKAA